VSDNRRRTANVLVSGGLIVAFVGNLTVFIQTVTQWVGLPYGLPVSFWVEESSFVVRSGFIALGWWLL
jgi:hypothetical protein